MPYRDPWWSWPTAVIVAVLALTAFLWLMVLITEISE